MKTFKIGAVFGSYYTVTGPTGEVYQNVALRCNADSSGFTCVQVIITKDTITGHVDIAWQHSDLTEGKLPIAVYDLEYQERVGFWAAVKEHIAQLNAGDFPLECVEYDF